MGIKRVAFDVTFLQDNAAQKTLSIKDRLLLNLLTHHNVLGGAYPGRATMAQELGITERSVRRVLRELEADDMIRRYGDYKGHALYRLPVGKKNELLGGSDRWELIVRLHGKVAHLRPQGGANLSGKVAHLRPQGGAYSSSHPGADSRQNHSSDSKKKRSEHVE